MLEKGRKRTDHEEKLMGWNKLLFKTLGDSPRYLSAEGEGRSSCLEVKIRDKLPDHGQCHALTRDYYCTNKKTNSRVSRHISFLMSTNAATAVATSSHGAQSPNPYIPSTTPDVQPNQHSVVLRSHLFPRSSKRQSIILLQYPSQSTLLRTTPSLDTRAKGDALSVEKFQGVCWLSLGERRRRHKK